MHLKEVKVRISDLEPGMYVSRLDRPWAETPYLLQGFHIKSSDDIDQLLGYCKYVYVDVELSNTLDNVVTLPGKNTHSDNEKQQLLQSMQGNIASEAPWFGVFTYGEFGPVGGVNSFHNYSLIVTAIA